MNFELKDEYYFIGIGGVGMAALANILADLGKNISGSDLKENKNIEQLKKRGIKIAIGVHSEKNFLQSADVVIISSAVNSQNPELLLAQNLNKKILKRGEFLGQLANFFDYKIAVSGSHGKTTTTAMITFVLRELGYNPAFAIGGSAIDFDRNGSAGNQKIFVSEIDESDGTQKFFSADCAIILNIEDDHSWSAGGNEQLFASFVEVAQKSKICFTWHSENCDKFLTNLPNVNFLDLTENNINLKVGQVGEHNAMNAWAAYHAIKQICDKPDVEIVAAFAKFSGVSRRMTTHKENFEKNRVLIEDYAHHPTELKMTLSALRKHYSDKTLCVVFQPHRYERVKHYGKDFAKELLVADNVIVISPFSAWIEDKGIANAAEIAQAIPNANYFDLDKTTFSELTQKVQEIFPQENAVWAIIGAGDITEIIPFLNDNF